MAGCTDDEANYDQLARESLINQTVSLIDTFNQHNAYQRLICNRNLTAIVKTVEELPRRMRKRTIEEEEKGEGKKRTRTQKTTDENRARTEKNQLKDGNNSEHEHPKKKSPVISADTRELRRKGSSSGIVTSQKVSINNLFSLVSCIRMCFTS